MNDIPDNSLQEAIDRLTDQFLLAPATIAPRHTGPPHRQDRTGVAFETDSDTHPHVQNKPAEAVGPIETGSDGSLTLDILLIGHLPVLANAWVATAVQYLTDHGNDNSQCLVFLCPENERVARLDLCTAFGADHPSPADHLHFNGATLRNAVDSLAHAAPDRLLVQLSEPDEALELGATLQVRRIILLTGADQAAIVAAYRLLKRLAMPPPTSDRLPHLSLLVAGCDRQRATDAVARLTNTVSVFLQQKLELIGAIETIRTTRIRTLRRYEIGGRFERWLVNDLTRMQPLEITVKANALGARLNGANGAVHQIRTDPPKGNGSIPHTPTPNIKPLGATEPTSAHGTASARSASHPTSLGPLVKGLQPLPVSCPYATGVDFAVDHVGHIHVLTRDAGYHEAPAVERLLLAGDWARDHRQLLNLLDSRVSLAQDTIVRHLFITDLGRRQRLLTDTHIRFHLLLSPDRTGGTYPIAIPLN